ncbi:hypothetical protein ACFRCG_08960 [Embleya sp. NPDC056575]|uniref:hypothetical protein n=1 Tax=unclassified Embleya TaxID=2699296 RepID=UPI0036B54326
MSGPDGRPAGDRYDEPAGYDPAAGYPGEHVAQGYPGHPGDPGQPYGGQPVESYGAVAAQAGQYGQPHPQQADHAAYGYQVEQYPQGYQDPMADQAAGGGYGYPDPQGVPASGGYGYDGATDVLPAITESGFGAYGGDGYGGGEYAGATEVMPAIVDDAGGHGGHGTGFEPEFEPGADYGAEFGAGTDFAADIDFDPGTTFDPDVDYAADPDPRVGTESAPASLPVPAPRRGDSPTRASRSARTPIWDPPGLLPGLCTVGLAGVLAVTAIAGKPALLLGIAFLQVLTAVGWFRLNGMWPARQGIALVVLVAFGTDAAVYAKGEQGLASVPAVLAGALLVTLAMQARSGARPGELLPALTVTTSAALITAFDVAYLVAGDLSGGPVDAGAAVVPAVLAAGVATLVRAVPLPPAIAAIPSWLLGSAAGAAAAVSLGGEAPYAALLGAGAAALALLGRRVAGYDHPSRFVHFTAGVSLPLALAAPAAYLLGRVMIG